MGCLQAHHHTCTQLTGLPIQPFSGFDSTADCIPVVCSQHCAKLHTPRVLQKLVASCKRPTKLHPHSAAPFPPSPRLAAQLARTEEAAKRALIRSDVSAKGSTAQQLLDSQREVTTLQAQNADLTSKLSRWGAGERRQRR
jgi:hypothetical protein